MNRTLYRTSDAIAVTENGRLVEYINLRENEQSGDILLAKVDRMMPGLSCAFADIGRKKDGFLPLEENSRTFTGSSLHSGDRISVQIRREENGEKGALLSRDLTIPGQYVILMPCNRHIGVSARIADPEKRESLRHLGADIAAGEIGLVLRAASENAKEDDIVAEVASLREQWRTIQEKNGKAMHPGEILYTCDPAAQMLRDYNISRNENIRGVSSQDTSKIENVCEMPSFVKHELAAATTRKVTLQNGGNLIIDRCEALTVIDVNTASAIGKSAKENTVTEVNLEACREAAVQIRLRDISGIILIDFIDMEEETNRSLVLQTLRETFTADRRKTVIHGWTSLGLMEITRKRV